MDDLINVKLTTEQVSLIQDILLPYVNLYSSVTTQYKTETAKKMIEKQKENNKQGE